MRVAAELERRVLEVFDVDAEEMRPYLALGRDAPVHHIYSLAVLVERAERAIERR